MTFYRQIVVIYLLVNDLKLLIFTAICLSGERLGEIQPTFSLSVNVGTGEGVTGEGLTEGRRGGVSLKTRGAGGKAYHLKAKP